MSHWLPVLAAPVLAVPRPTQRCPSAIPLFPLGHWPPFLAPPDPATPFHAGPALSFRCVRWAIGPQSAPRLAPPCPARPSRATSVLYLKWAIGHPGRSCPVLAMPGRTAPCSAQPAFRYL